jgi:type I site-specific restriction endonuclease
MRDWKNANSSQQRARFTVTDHSSRVKTGTPFLGFKPSSKSDRKRPLSKEPQRKNKQTPRNKPTQLTYQALSHRDAVVRFLTSKKYEGIHTRVMKGGNTQTHTPI